MYQLHITFDPDDNENNLMYKGYFPMYLQIEDIKNALNILEFFLSYLSKC